MKYQHNNIHHQPLPFTPGKAVCVGRNYVDHVHELNNTIPTSPLLFIKPASAFTDLKAPIHWPTEHGSCHYELELALLITQPISKADATAIQLDQFYYGLAIDLTLRDLQSQLKEQGHPWEKAKAFDGSCILSPFMSYQELQDNNNSTDNSQQNIKFNLLINSKLRQQGNTQQMITPIPELIAEASAFFTLEPGDILLTGTPAGVGPLKSGDSLELCLNDYCFADRPSVKL